KAFIGRVSDQYGDEAQWLISLASFLARKPPEKWIDDDVSAVQYRLTEFASRLRDLWRLQLHYEEVQTDRRGDIEATLIRVMSTSQGAREGVAAIDESGRRLIHEHYAKILEVLTSLPSQELRIAALAFLANEVLSKEIEEKPAAETEQTYRGAA